MPLPEPPRRLYQAPAWLGIGLDIPPRQAEPCWPVLWWQLNCDTLAEELLEPEPCPLTEREMRIPPAPVTP